MKNKILASVLALAAMATLSSSAMAASTPASGSATINAVLPSTAVITGPAAPIIATISNQNGDISTTSGPGVKVDFNVATNDNCNITFSTSIPTPKTGQISFSNVLNGKQVPIVYGASLTATSVTPGATNPVSFLVASPAVSGFTQYSTPAGNYQAIVTITATPQSGV